MDDNTELQWAYISKLLDKIDEQAERLHWDKAIDEAANVFDYANQETDAAKVFFEPYQYLFRLYERMKHMDEPKEFNEIYKTSYLHEHEQTEFFRIINYDFKMFLWLRNKGLTELLNNNYVDIPVPKLSASEVKSFEKKIKN